MSTKIHRQMTIEEILTLFPGKSQKLAHEMSCAGLHCVGCCAATWETLEGGMLGHGMEEGSIDSLVDRLNQILEEKEEPGTITLTERAAHKFLEILQDEGKVGWGLRFGEKTSGCKGLEFYLDYSQKPLEGDSVFHSHGISIHVHEKDLARLIGSTIDYVEGLQGAGFKISNPNVKSSCGCGNSHSYTQRD